jgi:hypothetical protein
MIERPTVRRADLGAKFVLAASLSPIKVSISAGQEADTNEIGVRESGVVFLSLAFFPYQGNGMDWIYPAGGLAGIA